MNRVLPVAKSYECKNIWLDTNTEEARMSLDALITEAMPFNITAKELPLIPGLIPVGSDVRECTIHMAGACRISPMLLTRLHRRQIAAETVPVLLLERLAAELNCTAGQVFTYLQHDASVRSSAMYNRDSRTSQPGERLGFEQALARTPDLPEEYRQEWTALFL